VTLCFADGVPPKDARQLATRAAAGEGGVRFLLLSPPLDLVGTIELR
jgi:hypothetical protein